MEFAIGVMVGSALTAISAIRIMSKAAKDKDEQWGVRFQELENHQRAVLESEVQKVAENEATKNQGIKQRLQDTQKASGRIEKH
ncbi:hypothetical protein OAU50_05065 [Planctomycetota bacterium]|nr:hypothetical protein [Planctomycetota bacterium]